MNKLYDIYQILYKEYGPQGWWPFLELKSSNDTKKGATEGYHILEYDFPKTQDQFFEICLGCILTQNTTFTSVVKSLHNLKDQNALNKKAIESMDIDRLKECIRPSGYFNQKANYIHEFIKFYNSLEGKTPSRDELLSVKGIGEETADSILLFAYKVPEFKVDAYTKRILLELGIIDSKAKYKDVKKLFEDELSSKIKDKEKLVIIYQEYHALIVEHCKRYYSKKPYGIGCFLKELQ
jgi:endonuclease-3 related protein